MPPASRLLYPVCSLHAVTVALTHPTWPDRTDWRLNFRSQHARTCCLVAGLVWALDPHSLPVHAVVRPVPSLDIRSIQISLPVSTPNFHTPAYQHRHSIYSSCQTVTTTPYRARCNASVSLAANCRRNTVKHSGAMHPDMCTCTPAILRILARFLLKFKMVLYFSKQTSWITWHLHVVNSREYLLRGRCVSLEINPCYKCYHNCVK
jgi:hypothetical protein